MNARRTLHLAFLSLFWWVSWHTIAPILGVSDPWYFLVLLIGAALLGLVAEPIRTVR